MTFNERMKIWWKNSLGDQILVCGHSHVGEFNLGAKYVNTGATRAGYGQYLKITSNGFELISERFLNPTLMI